MDYKLKPEAYDALREVVSFPSEYHFHPVGALHEMVSESKRKGLIAKKIPSICPGAVSPKRIHDKECEAGYM